MYISPTWRNIIFAKYFSDLSFTQVQKHVFSIDPLCMPWVRLIFRNKFYKSPVHVLLINVKYDVACFVLAQLSVIHPSFVLVYCISSHETVYVNLLPTFAMYYFIFTCVSRCSTSPREGSSYTLYLNQR